MIFVKLMKHIAVSTVWEWQHFTVYKEIKAVDTLSELFLQTGSADVSIDCEESETFAIEFFYRQ